MSNGSRMTQKHDKTYPDVALSDVRGKVGNNDLVGRLGGSRCGRGGTSTSNGDTEIGGDEG